MRAKVWFRRTVLRWSRQSRATRQLARDFSLRESAAFQLVADLERIDKANAVEIARRGLQRQRDAYYEELNRPENRPVAGARLSR